MNSVGPEYPRAHRFNIKPVASPWTQHCKVTIGFPLVE
jgi:hypothetical protein